MAGPDGIPTTGLWPTLWWPLPSGGLPFYRNSHRLSICPDQLGWQPGCGIIRLRCRLNPRGWSVVWRVKAGEPPADERSGHSLFVEEPGRFAAEMAAFMEEVQEGMRRPKAILLAYYRVSKGSPKLVWEVCLKRPRTPTSWGLHGPRSLRFVVDQQSHKLGTPQAALSALCNRATVS